MVRFLLVEEATAIGYVCANADGIRSVLGDEGQVVDRLFAAVRAGADPTALLSELDDALRRAGDVLGVRAHATRSYSDLVLLPGVGGGHRVSIAFLCPGRTCGRIWRPPADGAVEGAPACAVYGQAMSWEPL